MTFRASVEIEFALALPGGMALRAGLPRSRVRDDPAGRAERVQRRPAAGAGRRRASRSTSSTPSTRPGQYEVSVGALNPVAAADRSVLVRQTIRAVAQRHGLRVSFAPAVLAGGVGNGGHLHLSAWRDGRTCTPAATAGSG